MNHFSKDVDINIISYLNQEEPITKIEFSTAVSNVFWLKKEFWGKKGQIQIFSVLHCKIEDCDSTVQIE